MAIFEGRPPSLQVVLHRIFSTFQLQQISTKTIQYKALDYWMAEGSTLVCFDGALSQTVFVVGQGAPSNHTHRGSQNGF
jgi:hypothetical protein